MKKHLIVIGMTLVLLIVVFIGCIEEENKILGTWKHHAIGDFDSYNIYEADGKLRFLDVNKKEHTADEMIHWTYKIDGNIMTTYNKGEVMDIWDMEYTDSNTVIMTLKTSGYSYIMERVE